MKTNTFSPYKTDTIIQVEPCVGGFRINGQNTSFEISKGVVGIANYSTGLGHSCHPNICKTGSVKGMKARGYWNLTDKTVRTRGYIYNVSHIVISDPLDLLAYHMEYSNLSIPNGFSGEFTLPRVTG